MRVRENRLLRILARPYTDHFHRNPLLARETGIGHGPLWRSPMLWALVLAGAVPFASVSLTAWKATSFQVIPLGIYMYLPPNIGVATFGAIAAAILLPLWMIARCWSRDASTAKRLDIAMSPLGVRQLIGAKILVWLVPYIVMNVLFIPASICKAVIIHETLTMQFWHTPGAKTLWGEFYYSIPGLYPGRNSPNYLTAEWIAPFNSSMVVFTGALKLAVVDILRQLAILVPGWFFAAGLITRVTLIRFSPIIALAVLLGMAAAIIAVLTLIEAGKSGTVTFISFLALLVWWDLPNSIKRTYGMSEG